MKRGGEEMDELISYICRHYDPCSIIVYGSYADHTNGIDSDFDALVITNNQQMSHETSIVDGVQLDVFVYPRAAIEKQPDLDEMIQIFDGVIVMDTDDLARNLKQQVIDYLNAFPKKTEAQLEEEIVWCRKMLARTKRPDAEGKFRLHWLLVDSLEIFCDRIGCRYLGPKKTLKWMHREYPQAYQIYEMALFGRNEQALADWIDYLSQVKP